jgi:predicted AAA+ superfamily ATPase
MTKITVIVYSLQASEREAMGDVALLQMLDHLAARQEAKREPVDTDEIIRVIKKRLLAEEPDGNTVEVVADAYAGLVRKIKHAHATTEAEERQAEEDADLFSGMIRKTYPFHPALIDIMVQRWASIPDFQRTRGALRFLAVCLHSIKTRGTDQPLISPTDIPIDDPDVRHAFFSEVGQLEQFQALGCRRLC